MNIDLRNIDKEFENAIEEIKKVFNINTNSKALMYATVNFLKSKELQQIYKRDYLNTKSELEEIKDEIHYYFESKKTLKSRIR